MIVDLNEEEEEEIDEEEEEDVVEVIVFSNFAVVLGIKLSVEMAADSDSTFSLKQ